MGSQEGRAWRSVKPFVNGGLAGMLSISIIQPIDMVKVRIQLGAQGSPFQVANAIIKADGMGALYKGLSASLLRQATYTTARMGIFQSITDALKSRNGGNSLPLWQKAVAGLTAGGMGALVGNPADVALVRMQADATLPIEQRRNYKNVFEALLRIMRDEGPAGLLRGAVPTVTRAMALNMGQLASNDQAKEMLEDMGLEKGGMGAVVGAALIAGFFAAAFSLPFDFVKTRMQKMTANADGSMPYSSSIDCVMKTIKNEGPLRFYTGFPTYITRVGPHVVFTFIFLDAINKTQANVGL